MKKLILLQIIMIGFLPFCAVADKNPDKEVEKAYELRLNGKVDEAKAILESVLGIDSTNAKALYELARLNNYILTGGAGINMDDILLPANKAASYDPANVTYAYYKAIANFLNAFMGMQTGQGDVKNKIEETAKQFENVITLKPDYYEAYLYLVEIYGLLPKDMGGDSLKAVAYAQKLGLMDSYFGAKAKAVLSPENTDLVAFWKDKLDADPRNPDLLMEAGRACLFVDDPASSEYYFDQAMKEDPAKNILYLDLTRYHMYKVMENQDLAASELPVAKKYAEIYLASKPEPIVPLKAYAIGLEVIFEKFMGNKEESDKLLEKAKLLDPYFSRASGVPSLLLFDPPDEISHHYFSFFSPF